MELVSSCKQSIVHITNSILISGFYIDKNINLVYRTGIFMIKNSNETNTTKTHFLFFGYPRIDK